MRLTARGRLVELLHAAEASGGAVAAAGCQDPFSARIARSVGFDVLYMTGNGTSAVRLGAPDVGLLTVTEMADQAARIAASVDAPLVADADTGYGGVLNVIQTVELYARAGVAAMHLEDQRMPKRCGHLAGKQLVDPAEHASRIKAAVVTSGETGPLIIARTDALSVEGFDAAIDRAHLYGEAGAHVVFVEGMADEAQIEYAAASLERWPLAHAWVEGRSPELTVGRLGELGVRLVIHPLTSILATLPALQHTYRRLLDDGSPLGIIDELASFEEFTDFMGASQAAEVERSFTD